MMGPAGVEMVKKKVRSYSKQMEGPPARHIHISELIVGAAGERFPQHTKRCYSITRLSYMLSGFFYSL